MENYGKKTERYSCLPEVEREKEEVRNNLVKEVLKQKVNIGIIYH